MKKTENRENGVYYKEISDYLPNTLLYLYSSYIFLISFSPSSIFSIFPPWKPTPTTMRNRAPTTLMWVQILTLIYNFHSFLTFHISTLICTKKVQITLSQYTYILRRNTEQLRSRTQHNTLAPTTVVVVALWIHKIKDNLVALPHQPWLL